MNRLLTATTLKINGRGWHFDGKLCIQNDIAGYVESLFRDLTDAAKDHMVDFGLIQSAAFEQGSYDVGTQLDGVLLAQPAIALAQGRADGIRDDNFDHKDSLLISVDCTIADFAAGLPLVYGSFRVDEPNIQPITIDDLAHFWRHALILPRSVIKRMRNFQ